jgi:hypothetical protein
MIAAVGAEGRDKRGAVWPGLGYGHGAYGPHGVALAGPALGPASLAGPHAGPSALAGPVIGPSRLSGSVAGPAHVSGAVAGPAVVTASVAGPAHVEGYGGPDYGKRFSKLLDAKIFLDNSHARPSQLPLGPNSGLTFMRSPTAHSYIRQRG